MAVAFTQEECIMDHDRENEIIELGVASADTKGSLGIMDDEEGGWKHYNGLCDD
jgi:hypothetical protein